MTLKSLVGSPIARLEDLRLLRGRGQYVDDLSREGMLHAVILRSSIAHGRIRSIGTAAALASPAVRAVITAADIGSPVPRIPLRLDPLPDLKRFEQPIYRWRPKFAMWASPLSRGRGRECRGRRGRS